MTPDDEPEIDDEESGDDSCAHVLCSCAAGESGFCSPLCQAQAEADDPGETCSCGHADCEGAAAFTGI